MNKIGKYKKQPSGNTAFIVAPFLPKDLISWDQDLIFLLSQADRSIGRLNAIDQLVPDVDFFIYMYVGKEATLSSQIEGTQATLIDYVKAEVALEDKGTKSDVDEILNYSHAMNYGLNRLRDIPMCLRLIREVHKELLYKVRGKDKHPGEFRARQNWIGGPTIETATFIPPPANDLEKSLSEFEKFLHDSSLKLPPLIKAGIIHAHFETIHPFLDGNGRIGRLLITLFLHKEGILSRPLLYLSEFFNRQRSSYYDKLNGYRFNEGIESWLKFFLLGIKTVSDEAVETAKNITALREKHIKIISKFGRNAERALFLLNALYSQPMVSNKSVAKITALTSKTAISNIVGKFVDAGLLVETTGKERGRRYLYQEYLNQFNK